MSLRKKIAQGALNTAKKALETARLKRKTYKPATHTTGPSGRTRKITGKHEKARAAAEAAAKTAKNAKTVGRVRAGTATAGAVAGGVGAYAAGKRSGSNSNSSKPAPAAKPENKPTKPKINPLSLKGRTAHNENKTIRSHSAAKKPQEATLKTSYNKMTPSARAALSAQPKPKKKAVKKPVKMASVKTVRGRGNSGKTKVPVGSSIVRNRDGSIKKVKTPTGKAPKSKYARMTRAQINRLGGVERRAYKKWKASQK